MLMKDWAQSRVDVNGVSLRYFRSGSPSRDQTALPPLVLVHGFTDNALYYSRLAERLAESWDVVAYDCRGHGESGRAQGVFTDQIRVDDLVGVVQHLGLDRPVMIGHSMGAATIALATSQHPELSRGIVLEDPAWWEFPADMTSELLEAAESGRLTRNTAWHDSIVTAQAMTRDEGLVWRRADSPLWDDRDIALSLDARMQVELDLFTYFPTLEAPWRKTVAAIACPVLLVIGENERGGIISVEAADEARALNPLVQWSQITGAGHSIRYDQFAAFAKVVEQFVNDRR